MRRIKETRKLIFRKLNPSEHILTRSLYETCFSEDEPAFVDYYYANRADRNQIYAAILEEEQRIVSMVHVNPVEVTGPALKGETLTLPYFVAVATDPSWRRQGLMRTLMEMAMQELAGEGIPFGFLMPADEAYYTPLGFKRAWKWSWEEEACAFGKAAGNETAADEDAENETAEDEAAFLSDEELEQTAQQVNARLESRYDLFAVRSAAYYRDLELQQLASGGKLKRLAYKTGQKRAAMPEQSCMYCSARETFPSMMAKVLCRESYEKWIGRPMTDLNIMICEVV